MARVLYITNGLSGGLNASYEFARRVSNAGHTVSFLGYGELGEQINGQGYPYTRVLAADQAMADLRDRLDTNGRLRSFLPGVSLRRQIIKSREIESAVSAEQPDALIVDLEAHCCILATRSLGIPTVLKNDFFSLVWQRGIPPLHSEQAYPANRSERVQADLTWVRAQAKRQSLVSVGELHPARLARRWAPFRYNTVSRRDLKAMARSRDLRLRDMTTQRQWLNPHTYPSLPMMTATARELDFVTHTSANDQWIGPLVFRDRTDVSLSPEDRKRWQVFRDRNQGLDRPLLYCSFGTMFPDSAAMLSRVIAAIRSRPDYDLVVGLGGGNEQLDVTDDHNILVLDYAPQLEVLQSANAAISHGGINTINECLTFGVPMILQQSGPFDRPGNASRVEHHGVGVRAELATIDADALASLVDQVLTDDTLQQRVVEVQRDSQRYEDEQVVESAVEQLLAGYLDRSTG